MPAQSRSFGSAPAPTADDYVTVGDVLDWGSGSHTVEAWFLKTSPTTAQAKIVNKGLTANGTPANAGYGLRLTGGTLEFMVSSGPSLLTAVSVEPAINTWHHVAGVLDRSAGQMRLYVDGVLKASQPLGALGSLDTNIPLAFGALHRGALGVTEEFFPGCLDEVRLWNVARSGAEIQGHMYRVLTGSEPGLAGCWRFDEGQGSSAGDAVTAGHPATLGNGLGSYAPDWVGLAPAMEQRVLRVAFRDLGGVSPAAITNPALWQVRAAGADGIPGTGDDVDLSSWITGISWDATAQIAIVALPRPPSDDPGRPRRFRPIVDLAGNPLGDGSNVVLGPVGSETAPATVTLDLQAASDSGVAADDNVTNDATPTFDVTVNRRGSFTFDLDGDGVAEAEVEAPAAGVYGVTLPTPLADGSYTVRVTFTPAFGNVATAALSLCIDTRGPTGTAAANLLAPIYRQRVTFSEPVLIASVDPAGVTLRAPGGASLGNASAIAADLADLFYSATTGHWYQAVAVPEGLTWSDAEHAARARGGTLVCIGSDDENEFVRSLIESLDYWVLFSGSYHGPFIGLRQVHTTLEPAGGWEWVNGEALTYAAWNSGEPGNSAGNEDCAHYHLFDHGATWNDVALDWIGPGYVVEYDSLPAVASTFEITFAPLWEAGAYALELTPAVTDLAGNPMDQDGDATNGEIPDDLLSATLNVSAPFGGLRGERIEARGPGSAPFASLDVVFSRPLDPAPLSAVDITLTDAVGSVYHPVPSLANDCALALDLSGLSLSSPWVLLVGPAIAAADGSLMNQDGDDTAGEAADAFRALLVTADRQISATTLTYEGWALVVAAATLTVDGSHRVASLDLLNGATVTHPAATASQHYALDLDLAQHVRIDRTSAVDANGCGYLANRTLGNTTVGAASGKSAGTYGGYGADDSGTTNDVYGDYRNPAEPGSGGSGNIVVANRGGGLIRLAAATAVVEGAIRANGGDGQDNGWSNYAGAGAGGGIRLEVGRLGGAGLIQADGGSYGPRGGGGRVAIYYGDATAFDLDRVQALPGELGWGAASCGSVYLKNTAGKSGRGLLRIAAQSRTIAGGRYTALGIGTDAEVVAEDVLISGTNVTAAPHHQMRVALANLSVLAGAVLTHRPTDNDNEFALLLEVTDTLTIAADSAIDVSACGYLRSRTVGNDSAAAASGKSAASYGGFGASDSGTTNDVYGDYRDPAELGSGGTGNITIANAGGGLARISAAVLHLDGAIRANGGNGQDNGWNNYAGGGSGGGVRLDVGVLAGTGAVQADGAATARGAAAAVWRSTLTT